MAGATSIEWTDSSWNCVTGCDRVSSGCRSCYALTLAARLKAMGNPRYQRDGTPPTSGPGFGVTRHPDLLDAPFGWKAPRRVFVNSMSDFFHADIPDDFLHSMLAVMALTPRHTYQILTKRPQRMQRFMTSEGRFADTREAIFIAACWWAQNRGLPIPRFLPWPLPNVWLGVSVESQDVAWRLDWLARTPAAVRFVSAEPLLGPLDLSRWLGFCCPSCGVPHLGYCEEPEPLPLRWVIAGGESGPGARPIDPDWIRSLRDQCAAAGAALFVKQLGSVWARQHGDAKKGGEPAAWPADLRVREFPEPRSGIARTVAAGQAALAL